MDASEQDEATSEEEEIYDQEETAFEVNPEESSLKTSTIIAHLHYMVKPAYLESPFYPNLTPTSHRSYPISCNRKIISHQFHR